MADLLPSIPDSSAREDRTPRVVGLDEDAADEVFGALGSETARSLFAALTEEPAHPSALAERVETSLQNAQYHLGNLEDAELVEVVDTAYSAKGREMDVYAPADRALVVFAGEETDQSLLSKALGRLLGGLGVLSALSVVAEGLFGDETAASGPSYLVESDDAAAVDDGDSVTASGDDLRVADDAAAEEPAVEAMGSLADEFTWVGDLLLATGLSPGLAVLVVGGSLLGLGVAAWYLGKRQTLL